MLNPLKNYIQQFISLGDHEWKHFSKLFTETELKKGDFFAMEGRSETSIGFMISGVVRAFYRNNEGIEYNKTFFTDNEFFGAYASLVTLDKNQINIQALTDCKVLIANYQAITALFVEYRQIETLARLIAEKFYVNKEKREIELVLLQADARYKIFKLEYPNLENRIPQYHIASHLGITPTQLSRIRAKNNLQRISLHM
jgi:CRP-like cAMP-binding protein